MTDTACKNAKYPEGEARERYSDSGGLYLEVVPTGGKYGVLLKNSKARGGTRQLICASCFLKGERVVVA